MKKSIILACFIFMFSIASEAQSKKHNEHTSHWNSVEQFEQKGLPKSALSEVEKIYKKAKQNKNHPQLIKTLLYKSKYALTLEEDAQLKVINEFKKEISKSSFPTKNMLESIVADLYWQYFQRNRYQFYNRTSTASKVDPLDFRTWDLQTIFDEINAHFKKSLESTLLLQQADLSQFDALLTTQENSKEYRPTVYDFLAHRAISFYAYDEKNINKPSYQFKIEDPDLLGNNDEFVSSTLESRDSLSQQLNALHIYKNLTLFHVKDKNPKALIALTQQRLNFVFTNAVFNNKETKYLNTLKQLIKTYENDENSAKISYQLAQFLYDQSEDYTPLTKEENRFKRKEALEICENVLSKFTKVSKGTKLCRNLMNYILLKNLGVTTETYVPIDTYSKLLINHRNMEKVYFKAYKITHKQEQKLVDIRRKNGDKGTLEFIKKLEPVKAWDAQLKNEKDYQEHKTEAVLPALDQGYYLIMVGAAANYEDPNVSHEFPFSYSFLNVTNIALIHDQSSRKNKYQVVDRNNGKPLENVVVSIRNYSRNKYDKTINKTLSTNRLGMVEFDAYERYNNVEVAVKYKEDRATFGKHHLNRNYGRNQNEKTRFKAFLFTDRSIYRPGQIVYFKGISVAMNKNKSASVVNEKIVVTLKDVNYQTVQTLKVNSNEFGSFSGQFILPNGGLTGTFSIHANSNNKNLKGMINFSVEEYKRPKFEVEFKPVTETYKLNDSITIKGSATAFAGSNITDAKVVYRVVRTAQYPKWYWYSRPSIASEALEITHGETTTDGSGNFKVLFKSIPDLSVSKESQPTFNYKITADITDINGETRSTESIVKVGYHSLALSLDIAGRIDKREKEYTVNLTSQNLNGQFVATKGVLKIYKLKAPERTLRNRPWDAPDYNTFSSDEFVKLFPHEAYADEDDYKKWKLAEQVYNKNFDTKKSKEVTLKKIKNWTSGSYKVVVESTDKFGQLVKDEDTFNVFSDSDKKVADNGILFTRTNKASYVPGDVVVYKVGSAAQDVHITLSISKNYKVVDTKVIHLSDEIKNISIPVKKEDLGGFAVHYQGVVYNSFLRGGTKINVPYPKHELEIETSTFRDKLLPGQNETWSFKLKGSKGDKVAAEILASMYDASLDQFRPQTWGFNAINYAHYYTYNRSNASHSFGTASSGLSYAHNVSSVRAQTYDQLNWFGLYFNNYTRRLSSAVYGIETEDGAVLNEVAVNAQYSVAQPRSIAMKDQLASGLEREEKTKGIEADEENTDETNKGGLKGIVARKNLKETAFFYPHLKTDAAGNVSFNFTVPESLTKWKLQLLAHTKDMASATKEYSAVTQKELMVLPNPPRFLREGDKITFASKIANLTDKVLNGVGELQLFDALTNKPVDVKLGNSNKTKNFTIDAKSNTNISWTLQIPYDVAAVKYRIVAKAADFTDGEENALPVLSNRMLVTETMPMWLRSNETKTFSLDKLKNNTSLTLKNHRLTLEVTSNPAWYAVQALPYLMEYPYQCAEQTFSRYYANALGSHIANSNPRIQQVFNQWKSSDALLSNLEKNKELKSMIIQETPWLRDAQSETEQKKRIALLFDLNKMRNELQSASRKLLQMQMGNGGFPWFKGSDRPNRYITQHIASGFGHLDKLGIQQQPTEKAMLERAVQFLDAEILRDYNELLKRANEIRKRAKTKKQGIIDERKFLAQNHTSHFQIQYLYMRSFYKQQPINNKVQTAVDYYTNQSYKFWLKNNVYTKGMIALVAHRNANNTANKIIASLKENAINSVELGMYWKENTAGYYWYQAPIETQALLIETFSEIEGDIKTIDALKVWLLKNKQTNRWKTTKATTEAVYALLLQGSDWLEVTEFVSITVGDQKLDPLTIENSKVEAGTGYFKTSWSGLEITPKMVDVSLSKKSKGIAWGALYWQYFEDLDKITSAETPLKLKKKLFLKRNTDKGENLYEIEENTNLKLGDLVRVRIELRVDRNMEFVHMKDMRAAGFEPVNVLSRYKWQDGLGYYESTKDAATNFFFDYLPKGIYVFEYDLRVKNKGDFSNGITTIQSMYAPEFSSHSEGVRVLVQ